MNKSKLVLKGTQYHRNGVCGRGFWVVEFFDLVTAQFCVGTVFNHSTLPIKDAPNEELCYSVITPTSLEMCWRGDHYIDWMKEQIIQ